MDAISVYVAVGAISIVNCEIGYHSFLEPSQGWYYNHVHKDDWKPKYPEGYDETNTEAAPNSEQWNETTEKVSLEDAKEDGGERRNEFVQGLRHFKRVYDQCNSKVNRRMKKMTKTRVKSTVGRHLSDIKEYVLSLYKCVKVFSFRSLDEVLEENVIPLTDHAYFVRDGLNATEETSGTGQVSVWTGRTYRSLSEYATDILNKDWSVLIYDRLDNLLRSHSLKFQVDRALNTEGRGRRRHHMFAMMVMGFMIMVSILIPMGFQFLTVLGGKSLLMAKLALIMSAINGLKKIATSNVGYGFYHSGADGHHHDHVHHGFHEKLYQTNPNQYAYNP